MKKDTMKVTIRGPLRDLWRFITHISERRRVFRRSSSERPGEKYSISLRQSLHPEVQYLLVDKIIIENDSTRSYTLIPDTSQPGSQAIAAFRAGQYLSVEVQLESGLIISRPFSISNSPEEARRGNSYLIAVKNGKDSFIPGVMAKSWEKGTALRVSDPWGQFYHHPLSDTDHLVFIAGGSGITPFRSMARDILSKHESIRIVLIQGAAVSEELLFSDFFLTLEKNNPERFKWIPVLSETSETADRVKHSVRSGFIDSNILAEAMESRESTLYICGPQAMHSHIEKELMKSGLKPKRIRREDYGVPGMPAGRDPVQITVKMAGSTRIISADKDETVLVALERSGLNPPSRCRTGSCGWCRGSLLEGKIRYDKEPEGLRSADRSAGYFHPCAAKPESNLVVDIPGRPGINTDK